MTARRRALQVRQVELRRQTGRIGLAHGVRARLHRRAVVAHAVVLQRERRRRQPAGGGVRKRR